MQMRHAFTGIAAMIDDEPVAGTIDLQFGRDFLGRQQQLAKERCIVRFGIANSGNQPFWNDEHMNRSFGLNVVESEEFLILVHNAGGYFPVDDLLKQRHCSYEMENNNSRCQGRDSTDFWTNMTT